MRVLELGLPHIEKRLRRLHAGGFQRFLVVAKSRQIVEQRHALAVGIAEFLGNGRRVRHRRPVERSPKTQILALLPRPLIQREQADLRAATLADRAGQCFCAEHGGCGDIDAVQLLHLRHDVSVEGTLVDGGDDDRDALALRDRRTRQRSGGGGTGQELTQLTAANT